MQITKYKFHKLEDGSAGVLVFLEACKDVPFDVKRVYYIFGVGENIRRGNHAHKRLRQILICVHGSCKVLIDDGCDRMDICLDDPSEGLYVGELIWREMYDFSPDAVLLVLASEYYDEQDYIRDYSKFIEFLKEREI